jgi:hypothetical protein
MGDPIGCCMGDPIGCCMGGSGLIGRLKFQKQLNFK